MRAARCKACSWYRNQPRACSTPASKRPGPIGRCYGKPRGRCTASRRASRWRRCPPSSTSPRRRRQAPPNLQQSCPGRRRQPLLPWRPRLHQLRPLRARRCLRRGLPRRPPPRLSRRCLHPPRVGSPPPRSRTCWPHLARCCPGRTCSPTRGARGKGRRAASAAGSFSSQYGVSCGGRSHHSSRMTGEHRHRYKYRDVVLRRAKVLACQDLARLVITAKGASSTSGPWGGR